MRSSRNSRNTVEPVVWHIALLNTILASNLSIGNKSCFSGCFIEFLEFSRRTFVEHTVDEEFNRHDKCRDSGGGGLPNVKFTGMCHRLGSIFHFRKSRTGPEF